ncbi:MAG: EAL domain-containing protein [Cycloclasticus pugetii]
MKPVKSLKLQIVAEGVETQDDLDLCINLGVDKVQGYFFDKALPVDVFERKYLQLNNKKVL